MLWISLLVMAVLVVVGTKICDYFYLDAIKRTLYVEVGFDDEFDLDHDQIQINLIDKNENSIQKSKV